MTTMLWILGGFVLLGFTAVVWTLRRTAGAEAISSTAGMARGADLLIRTEALVGLEWAARKRRPLSQGLWSIVPEVSRRGQLRLQAVAARLEDGATLDDALREAPKIFPGPLRRILVVAAHHDVLDALLPRLVARGRAAHANATWAAAMAAYPVWGAGIAYFLMTTIAPKLEAIHASLEVEAAGLAVTHAAAWVVIALPLAVAATLIVAAVCQRSEGLRLAWFTVGWRLPLARRFIEARWWADVTALLGALLERGVPEAEALDALAELEGPRPLCALLRTAAARVREGEPITAVLPAVLPGWARARFTFDEAVGGPRAGCDGVAQFAAERRDGGERAVIRAIYPVSAVAMGMLSAAWLYHGALLSVRVSDWYLQGRLG